MKRFYHCGVIIFFWALTAVGKGEPVIEIHEQVEYPPGLIEKVKEAAGKQRPEAIRKIWIGQLVHPLGYWGARVEYEPEQLGTYAIARKFIADVPGEQIRKFYPRLKIEGYGFRFSDAAFTKESVHTEIVRVFPLKTVTVFLPLDDDLTYKQVLALLQAIEEGRLQQEEFKSRTGVRVAADGSTQFVKWGRGPGGALPGVADLPQIKRIYKEGDHLEVETRTRNFGGRTFSIKQKEDRFIFIRGGSWRS